MYLCSTKYVQCKRHELRIESIKNITRIFTGLPGKPSHKFGFRSSVQKNGLPAGGGKTRGSGTEKRCSHKWFHKVSYDFLLHRISHEYFLYLVSAPPEKPRRRCEPEEGYLRCSKRFDHRSHFISFVIVRV